MSSCLSGGGRTAYGIDLDIIKSTSTSTRTSHSSSPSSTISESSNSPLALTTRKPRTQRKRPNQIYNEAATLLSTAYPNIFSANDCSKPCKFIKPHEYSSFSFEDSTDEMLLPFAVDKPAFPIDSIAYEKPFSIDPDEYCCQTNSSNLCEGYEDFDAESILDEEFDEGGIDTIMGNLGGCLEEETNTCNNSTTGVSAGVGVGVPVDFCYGYPLGLGLGLGGRFDFGFGMMRGGIAKALRQNDEGDWWRFPAVNMGEISPSFNKPVSPEKKKKKKKKVMKLNSTPSSPAPSKEKSVPVANPSSTTSMEDVAQNPKSDSTSMESSMPVPNPTASLQLKLNYDDVLDAWSDKGSPFSEDLSGQFSGSDALARLAQIDLFGENGAMREAIVQRYKEKRRTRLFSKKIRYQVRKVNADQRPRMKGRFVRRPNSSGSEET